MLVQSTLLSDILLLSPPPSPPFSPAWALCRFFRESSCVRRTAAVNIFKMGGRTRCICGKPAGHNRFMIACDKCNFWLHGSCVKISKRSRKNFTVASRLPAKWCCPPCRENPGNLPLVVAETEEAAPAFVPPMAVQVEEVSLLKEDFLILKHDVQGLKVQLHQIQEVNIKCLLKDFEDKKEGLLKDIAHREETIAHLQNVIENYREEERKLKAEVAAFERCQEDILKDCALKEEHLKHRHKENIEEKNKKIADLESVIKALEESKKTSANPPAEECRKKTSGHLSTIRVDSPFTSAPKKLKRLSLSKRLSQPETTADDFDVFDRDAFIIKKPKKLHPSML